MKKLKLNELKVQSFVTKLEEPKSDTVKGGSLQVSCFDNCVSQKNGICPSDTPDVSLRHCPSLFCPPQQ